jgi:thioredoxin 1
LDIRALSRPTLRWALFMHPTNRPTMFFKKRTQPVSAIVHAVDDDFDARVAGHGGVTLVDFWAPWCAPCHMMAPILEEIAIEHADQGVQVVKVNVDDAPRTSMTYGIASIPTLVFFKGGEPQFEMVGLVPKPVLERELAGLSETTHAPEE